MVANLVNRGKVVRYVTSVTGGRVNAAVRNTFMLVLIEFYFWFLVGRSKCIVWAQILTNIDHPAMGKQEDTGSLAH